MVLNTCDIKLRLYCFVGSAFFSLTRSIVFILIRNRVLHSQITKAVLDAIDQVQDDLDEIIRALAENAVTQIPKSFVVSQQR